MNPYRIILTTLFLIAIGISSGCHNSTGQSVEAKKIIKGDHYQIEISTSYLTAVQTSEPEQGTLITEFFKGGRSEGDQMLQMKGSLEYLFSNLNDTRTKVRLPKSSDYIFNIRADFDSPEIKQKIKPLLGSIVKDTLLSFYECELIDQTSPRTPLAIIELKNSEQFIKKNQQTADSIINLSLVSEATQSTVQINNENILFYKAPIERLNDYLNNRFDEVSFETGTGFSENLTISLFRKHHFESREELKQALEPYGIHLLYPGKNHTGTETEYSIYECS